MADGRRVPAERDSAAQTRRADRGDTEPLVSLWLALIEHHRQLDPGYPSLPNLKETLRAEIRRGLASAHCEFQVGVAEGDLVGFVFAEIQQGGGPPSGAAGAWIHEIYVAPEQRRRRLATQLLDAVQPFFQHHDAAQLRVRIESGNREGAAFWSQRGFHEQARILARAL